MAVYLRDGFRGTCASPASGTGPYIALAAVSGFRAFSSLTDGDTVLVGVRDANGWKESFIATKSGGATPTLTRTTIKSNINGTLSPIDWSALGSPPLVIYSTISGIDTPGLGGTNTFTADQSFPAMKLRLSSDSNSYLVSPSNNRIDVGINSSVHSSFYAGGASEPIVQVQWTDNGATAGPMLVMDRVRSSVGPLGYVQFLGRNASSVLKAYAQIVGDLVGATAGAESGGLILQTLRAGSIIEALKVGSNFLRVFPGIAEAATGVLISKTASAIANVGIELLTDGRGFFTAQNLVPLSLNRTGTISGSVGITDFYTNGGLVGSITVDNAGTVTYGPFLGSHFSEWHAAVAEPTQWEKLGTVVCTAEGLLPGFGDRLPLVVPSTTAGDRRVYGVMLGRRAAAAVGATNEPGAANRNYLQIAGVGAGRIKVTGTVEAGDFLETSDVPGAARSQLSEFRTTGTVAKATQDSPDDGSVRLVACTFEAG
jgi:hypothetical protein